MKGFEAVALHGCTSGLIPVPVIGDNGNWFIGNDDTGVKAGTTSDLDQRLADLEAKYEQLNSDFKFRYVDIEFLEIPGDSNYSYTYYDFVTPSGYIPLYVNILRNKPTNTGFGSSVSISGNRLLVECYGISGTYNGTARIYFVKADLITN